MNRPFVVDIFRTDSKNGVSKRRLQADSYEDAMHLMEVHRIPSDVTVIKVSERIGPGLKRLEKRYVWTRGL